MMDSFGTNEYISCIVSKHSQNLFRAAYSVLHNHADAQDIVQEVFIKLLDKRPVFHNEEHEKAWLIRVTINSSKNLLKKRRREYDSGSDDVAFQNSMGDNTVLKAVLSLDEKYSTVVHLYYYEDYSIAQIAQILRIPSATVGTRLSRARAILKEKLKGDIT